MRKATKQDECFLSVRDFMVIGKASARMYQILYDHTDKKTHACTLQNAALASIFNRENPDKIRFGSKTLKNLREAGLIRIFLKENKFRAIFCKEDFDKIDGFLALNPEYKEIYSDVEVEEKEFDRLADPITMLYE